MKQDLQDYPRSLLEYMEHRAEQAVAAGDMSQVAVLAAIREALTKASPYAIEYDRN